MRYIPNTPDDRAAMLRDIGVSAFEDLLSAIPGNLRLNRPLNLPDGKSEFDVKSIMRSLARKNLNTVDHTSFLGAGSYDHYVPTAVNTLSLRSEYVTAYTPYQPEVAQATLQVIYEFQSMICELYGMEAANASMYDGGTALAEAIMLAAAQTRRTNILCPPNVHPLYLRVARTLVEPQGITLQPVPLRDGGIDRAALESLLNGGIAAVVVQYPNFFGIVEDISPFITAAQANGALAIVVADPLAMGVLEPPGSFGADIVVGEGQSLGNLQSYGGPYLGLFACKANLIRRMPGRIVGVTRDVDGRRGFVLTLQTREQHIRRDKATSNICTNEGLCATRATFYMSMLGPRGLASVGEACLHRCAYLRQQLTGIPGVHLAFGGPHFKEFAIRLDKSVEGFLHYMAERKVLAGVPLKWFGLRMDDSLLVAVTETKSLEDLDGFAAGVKQYLEGGK
ncbi:aminomethyl-transferring glycine dehydrogenase subunit GcvPA [candidate division KSB1 bacterium]|nr:aminomethyl-transferring glycine dehydrogenase subunit GcvPA [candidate division KSB1 bacterium]